VEKLSCTVSLEEIKEVIESSLGNINRLYPQVKGIIRLKPDIDVFVIPDLHGRRKLLMAALMHQDKDGETIIEKLARGKVQVVVLGDLMHTEEENRWKEIENEYRQQRFKGQTPRMDIEMTDSLGTAAMAMLLKTRFPENFHWIKGNHDNLANSSEKGNQPFAKYSDSGEGLLVKEWIEVKIGKDFLNRYAEWENRLPVFAIARNFVASHSEPDRAYTEKEIDKREDRLVEGLTWTRNEGAYTKEVLKNIFGDKWEEKYYIVGHTWGVKNIPENRLLIVNNPRDLTVLYIKSKDSIEGNMEEIIISAARQPAVSPYSAPGDASARGLDRAVVNQKVEENGSIKTFKTVLPIITIIKALLQYGRIVDLPILFWRLIRGQVQFVRGPPTWNIGTANYVDRQGINYIILPRNIPLAELAHDINAVLHPELIHKNNNLTQPQLPSVAGRVAAIAPRLRSGLILSIAEGIVVIVGVAALNLQGLTPAIAHITTLITGGALCVTLSSLFWNLTTSLSSSRTQPSLPLLGKTALAIFGSSLLIRKLATSIPAMAGWIPGSSSSILTATPLFSTSSLPAAITFLFIVLTALAIINKEVNAGAVKNPKADAAGSIGQGLKFMLKGRRKEGVSLIRDGLSITCAFIKDSGKILGPPAGLFAGLYRALIKREAIAYVDAGSQEVKKSPAFKYLNINTQARILAHEDVHLKQIRDGSRPGETEAYQKQTQARLLSEEDLPLINLGKKLAASPQGRHDRKILAVLAPIMEAVECLEPERCTTFLEEKGYYGLLDKVKAIFELMGVYRARELEAGLERIFVEEEADSVEELFESALEAYNRSLLAYEAPLEITFIEWNRIEPEERMEKVSNPDKFEAAFRNYQAAVEIGNELDRIKINRDKQKPQAARLLIQAVRYLMQSQGIYNSSDDANLLEALRIMEEELGRIIEAGADLDYDHMVEFSYLLGLEKVKVADRAGVDLSVTDSGEVRIKEIAPRLLELKLRPGQIAVLLSVCTLNMTTYVRRQIRDSLREWPDADDTSRGDGHKGRGLGFTLLPALLVAALVLIVGASRGYATGLEPTVVPAPVPLISNPVLAIVFILMLLWIAYRV
jgi:predicted phosphodiesterase